VETINKLLIKNLKGEVINQYEVSGYIFTDYILPLSEINQRNYGYDPLQTRQTITRDNAIENSYIRFNGKVFYIDKVIDFPKHNQLFLTEVK
jgi:hypothetical protein